MGIKMAFTDYKTISAVQQDFQIKYEQDNFLDQKEFEISSSFIEEFQFSYEYIDVRASEYAICENIIYPILRESYKQYHKKLSIWSHKSIQYDEKLVGTPDYIVAMRSELGKLVFDKPLLMVVEAKKNDFDEGWGQCLAELVAAQKVNDNPKLDIYGIVTDGQLWQFGKLKENTFVFSQKFLTISDLKILLFSINYLLESLVLQFATDSSLGMAKK